MPRNPEKSIIHKPVRYTLHRVYRTKGEFTMKPTRTPLTSVQLRMMITEPVILLILILKGGRYGFS